MWVNNKMNIGRQIKRFRKSRGIKQFRLAELVGVTQTTMSLIESGKRGISIKTLEKITKQLGVTIILADDENLKDLNYLYSQMKRYVHKYQ